MPVELVAHHLVAVLAPRHRSGLVLAAQLIAIMLVAALTLALASLPSNSIAGSAQEVVAGP